MKVEEIKIILFFLKTSIVPYLFHLFNRNSILEDTGE